MPTTRPRHPVTETDVVARALDQAAVRWPGVPRARLIRLVLADWAEHRHSLPAELREARRRLEGSLPGSAKLYNRAAEWDD